MNDPAANESAPVRSVTLKSGVSRITLHGVPHQPGIATKIFGEIGTRGINVDDIIQTASDQGRNVIISFTVDTEWTEQARVASREIAERFGHTNLEITEQLARLRIVGMGMRAHSGVAAKVFDALSAVKANIENISTSEIVISILVPEANGELALNALYDAFGLERDED